MSIKIESGGGNGRYEAKVDSSNRLSVASLTSAQADLHSVLGNRYNFNTSNIILTSANASGIMYLKNNENEDFHITAIVFNFGPSTGGSGSIKVEVIKNPTTGTLISGASAVPIASNFNFGNSNTLSALAYKGAEANTITDGTNFLESLVAPTNRVALALGDIILTKGNSIAIKITPQTSNTSMTLNCAISGFRQTLDD